MAEGHDGSLASAALRGAVARAIDDFAAAEAIDKEAARELRSKAVAGALEAYKTMDRLNRGASKDEERDRFAVEFWLRSVPSYLGGADVQPGVPEAA